METGIVEERKNLKRNRVISTLRYGGEVSRHDVKKLTGYSMTTVLSIISDLLEKGLLEEESCTAVRTGRRPTWLHLKPDGLYAIGVEFNADCLNCVIVDFGYQLIYSDNVGIELDDSANVLLDKLQGAIRRAIAHLNVPRERIAGIGLGMPGWVDREHGTALSYAYLRAWKDIPIQQLLEKEFACPVFVENNINTMAIAYRWQTYQQRAEDFVFLSLKHGVRLALFINNQLFSGSGNAGEIGHVKLVNGNRFCSCGRRGCLDSEVSSRAIRQKIKERMDCGLFAGYKKKLQGDLSKISVEDFVDQATRGNPDALALLGETAEYMGQCLSMILGTLNPRRIIIASRSGMGGKVFSDMVQKVLEQYTVPTLLDCCNVECITVPDLFGARGAAMMVLDNEFQVIEEAL